MRDFLKILQTSRTATTSALQVVDQIRAAISAKKEEIAALQRAPRPVAEAMRLFDAWADHEATKAVDALRIDVLLDSSVATPGLRLPMTGIPQQTGANAAPAAEALLGLILLTCRNQVRAVIQGQLSDMLDGREALTNAERATRLTRAQADLAEAERTEEAAIRSLEAVGVTIARRADASPAAVLASDLVP
jgi:hypothetical protein